MSVTTDDYLDFCEGVRLLAKVDLAQYKRGQMERRIRSFAERRGVTELGNYLTLLRRSTDELDAFLDRMTINVSQLWRHPEQWHTLSEHVLPRLALDGRVRAWSAGCSYGAEAHTLAAVCRDAIPRVPVTITGTDIDTRMIARAREGRFSIEDARIVPADALRRHFVAIEDGYQARPELRSLLTFEIGDLLRMRIRPAALDLVMCRNTVIYFTDETRNALHARLADALRPGGYLVVGATERVADPAACGLEPAHPFTYRKVA